MKKTVRTFLRNDEGKYLLVKHHKNGSWTIPGGRIEDNEDIYETLKREILEELNLEISINGNKLGIDLPYIKEKPIPICVYKIEYENRKGELSKKLEYILLSTIKSGKIKIKKDEISDYRFFTKDEIISEESIYTQFKDILLKID